MCLNLRAGFQVWNWVSGSVVVNHWGGGGKLPFLASRMPLLEHRSCHFSWKSDFGKEKQREKENGKQCRFKWQTLEITFLSSGGEKGEATCQLFVNETVPRTLCNSLVNFFHLIFSEEAFCILFWRRADNNLTDWICLLYCSSAFFLLWYKLMI